VPQSKLVLSCAKPERPSTASLQIRPQRDDWARLETDVRRSTPRSQAVTLEDAGTYITKLPKAEHEAAEWLAAMEALILVATSDGPSMFARIGVMRALNRHVERVFSPDRRDHHWGRRKLKRDM
jgi:hypothetical protein